jgi:aminoglycoside 3-N-acetyltransferase
MLPAPVYPYCQIARRKTRTWLKRMDRALDRRTLSREEFIDHLTKLGVIPGATVYLHSSMDEFRRRVPSIAPFTLINVLKELVGEEGTLLVPTFPLQGLQYHHVQAQRIFDVKRTPSQVGLFTELFRRSAGVTRSLHPTHPIAAWGKHSKELVAEHHLGTAFGETSPVYKMQRYNGLVVGIGVTPKRCFTLYHMAEELHPLTHAMQYLTESFEMTILQGREKIPYQVTPLRPDRIRRYDRAERILRHEGLLRYYSVLGLKLSAARVDQFLRRAQELIDANLFYSRRSRTRRPRAFPLGPRG